MSDPHLSCEMWLSRLKDHLQSERYSSQSVYRCVHVARDFMASLQEQQVELGAARPADLDRYLEQARRSYRRRHGCFPSYQGWRYIHTSAAHMLLRLVHGEWPPVQPATNSTQEFHQEICAKYVEWMINARGLASETTSGRRVEARRFLDWLGERAGRKALAAITLRDVDAYMKERAGSLCRRSLARLAADVRGFLKWLHMVNITSVCLAPGVIGPSLRALEGIPSALPAQDVKIVLMAAQQDCTRKGIRDFAILMLLATYGVRAGEITALRLDDVDWRKEVIRIRHSKTGATSYLPFVPGVGEALLHYLESSRPETSAREVFLRCRAPYRPLRSGSSLYGLVQCRLEAAAVHPHGRRGPHAFRHARAVSLLRAQVPQKEIGDLLGHRAAGSTLPYLKLATEDLRAVALEIPTGVKI